MEEVSSSPLTLNFSSDGRPVTVQLQIDEAASV
jgi:hypothetical protein